MLEEGGKLVLTLIGKDPEPKGIIEISDMDHAITRLESVILDNELNSHPAPKAQIKDKDGQRLKISMSDSDESVDPVTIKQRVIPFLEMLRTCKSQGNPIVWGV